MNPELLARPQVKNFEPYAAGMGIDEVRRKYRLRRVIKLASNENAAGPSAQAVAAMRRAAAEAHRYPDGPASQLRRALEKKHRLPAGSVILGAGSDDIIELLGKAFLNPGDEIVVSEHAFVRYRMAADLMAARAIVVPMRDLRHDLERMAEAVTPRTKFVFVANPNNPTGTWNTRTEVEELLVSVPSRTFVVFDEAYYEYARTFREYPDTLRYMRRQENVIVLRTFSKIHGLAGLRVGYGMMHPEVVSLLDRIRPPFNVSHVAQAAAMAAVSDGKQVRRSLAVWRRGRKQLEEGLRRIGLRVTPSAANFFLVEVHPLRGMEVFRRLLARGVIVRPVEEYGLPHHIRVTVGLPAENRAFLRALEEVLR